MTDKICVLLVDDQKLIRLGFRLVLEAEGDIEVVGDCSDGVAALEATALLQPDVILMDVRMPKMDGIEATTRIVAQHPSVRIVVLTTFDLDEYAFGAIRAGACGFLLKDAHPIELISAVRAAHAGDATLSPRVTRRMIQLFGTRLPTENIAEASSTAHAAVRDLTERENDVFLAIARGLTNAEIAQEFFVSESTVKTHVGRVLSKLGARDRVHAVILAHRWGLAASDAEDADAR